jgi:excinuclease ABC subunit B
VKSRIADILDSVYEKDHVRPDISDFAAAGNMVGNNLKAHLEYLQKKMRDAAADLNFEEAARLRDEIKRLTELELTLSDDPLARAAESESPVSGREKGRHNKGVAKHRTAEERERFRKLDDARAEEEAAKAARPNLFRKPELDEMGTSGDHATPAGAVSRSLFKKQSHSEAHGSDYGVPDDSKSLFRKNSLDEMTVRRTEKPVPGGLPAKPQARPGVAPDGARSRDAQGAQDKDGRSEPRSGDSVSEKNDDPRPLVRARSGAGSYEDSRDTGRQKRRTGKTGRPGR